MSHRDQLAELERQLGAAQDELALKERQLLVATEQRASMATQLGELWRKLRASYSELGRRHRRDQEIVRELPALAARLQSLATRTELDLASPLERDANGNAIPRWDQDPGIDWAGIDGGDH